MDFVSRLERTFGKATVPQFRVGDSVDVHYKIKEGERERIQLFSGVVIAMKGNAGRQMFIVRRIVQGEGVERAFPIHSPRVADVVVKRHGRVRRAKLFYLRERTGKSTRLEETFDRTAAEKAAHAASGEGKSAKKKAAAAMPAPTLPTK
ncbi:MAG: 50S ribosomal protein L19 [Planctomycetes bacterium]|nr:50S ribosomal protein L19 [Planctomycetota bacterium]